MLAGKVQKDLLELGLRDHVVLDRVDNLDVLDQSEYARQNVRRVVVYVYVEEAVAVLLHRRVLEFGQNELNEFVYESVLLGHEGLHVALACLLLTDTACNVV